LFRERLAGRVEFLDRSGVRRRAPVADPAEDVLLLKVLKAVEATRLETPGSAATIVSAITSVRSSIILALRTRLEV